MKKNIADFTGGSADQGAVAARIRDLYEKTGYIIDTHTGVASAVYEQYRTETGDTTKTVIASTASPYKFAASVLHAIAPEKTGDLDEFGLIDLLTEISGLSEPPAITDIRTAPVRHRTVSSIEGMPDTVRAFLKG